MAHSVTLYNGHDLVLDINHSLGSSQRVGYVQTGYCIVMGWIQRAGVGMSYGEGRRLLDKDTTTRCNG